MGSGGSLSGLSILVVEDNDDLREALAMYLSSEEALVRTARHGLEALEELKTDPLPGVILCDLMMPQMDGCTLLTHLKQDVRLASVPVIAFTARGSDAGMLRTLHAQFDGYLVKPASPAVLLQEIRRVVGR